MLQSFQLTIFGALLHTSELFNTKYKYVMAQSFFNTKVYCYNQENKRITNDTQYNLTVCEQTFY